MMLPVCQFMERLHKTKFAGLVVMVSVVIFGSVNYNVGIVMGLAWVLLWVILTVVEQGEFGLFTRRWLYIPELRIINGH